MVGLSYASKVTTMYSLVTIIFSILITISSVATKNAYFPDAQETPEFMKPINELIEERARQRFLEHWQRLQLNRNILQRAEAAGPAFTYHTSPVDSKQIRNNPIEFAVGPSDPRFYDPNDDSDIKTNLEEKAEELIHSNPNIILPPSPQDIKPKLPININQQLLGYNLWYKDQKSDENLLPQHVSAVVQKPVEMDGAITMYIVALIGGIGAAVTVGLISIIIGWYTLHKKAKAAVDVEYPAYGVTGPNKESSPSSDRRLAQSAQMYHYQHQKQQIIALEYSSTTENNVKNSDAESEDDNEVGDYTVYECPGLAPTGEMEVKNPLFHDEGTLTLGKYTE